MKKSYVLIGLFLLFIISISIVGSMMVTGNEKLYEEDDILLVQSNKEVYFSGYGFDLDNPNVIVNPYGNSPLTATILFESSDYVEVEVTILGKDGEDDISNRFKRDKYHVIPIYGLYPDYDNTVIIRAGDKVKNIKIKTDKLPDDFEFSEKNNETGKMVFYNSNYPYAVSGSGNVRWFLSEHYFGDVHFTSEGKILVGSNRYTENDRVISFYEMDLLGKIYNEYLIPDEYYGKVTSSLGNYFILSDDILEIDSKSGEILNSYGSNQDYDDLVYFEDEVIVEKDGKQYKVGTEGLEETEYFSSLGGYDFYTSNSNYAIIKGRRLGELKETEKEKFNISILKYEKADFDYADVYSDGDRIVVTNNSDDEMYVILDKLFDKRVYKVSDKKYINKAGLNGKYTIYFKIKNKVYKTNYYIEV